MSCSFYPHCSLLKIISGHVGAIISALNIHTSEYNVKTSFHTTVLLSYAMPNTVLCPQLCCAVNCYEELEALGVDTKCERLVCHSLSHIDAKCYRPLCRSLSNLDSGTQCYRPVCYWLSHLDADTTCYRPAYHLLSHLVATVWFSCTYLLVRRKPTNIIIASSEQGFALSIWLVSFI
jgi:hypothetical protein